MARASDDSQGALKLLGGPTGAIALSMLEALVGMEIGEVNRQKISDYLKACTANAMTDEGAVTREQLESEVHFIRVEKSANAEIVKLLISSPEWAMRPWIRKAFQNLVGVEWKHGTAPPGWMEDELQTWLEALL